MLKRFAFVSVSLVALLWLAGSIFVSVHPSPRTKPAKLTLGTDPEGRLRWQVSPPGDADAEPSRSRLVDRIGGVFSPAVASSEAYGYLISCGEIDPRRGVRLVTIGCVYRNWPPLSVVVVRSTDDDGWSKHDAVWRDHGTSTPSQDETTQSVLIEVELPSDAVAVRLVARERNGKACSITDSLPRSDAWPDRLFEAFSASPVFRLFGSDD